MRTAPASDLMFSQTTRSIDRSDLVLPVRACATTLVGLSGAVLCFFVLVRFDTDREKEGTLSNLGSGSQQKRETWRIATSLFHRQCTELLLEVLVDELRHLEHRDLALATEDGLELVVGVDHAALLGVLETV